MSPKVRTRQPKRTRLRLGAQDVGELPEKRPFWVRVTAPRNCVGLSRGQNLLLHVGDERISVLNGVARLGELEPAGVAWVRRHGYSSCVFEEYGSDPEKRFQVRIAAG